MMEKRVQSSFRPAVLLGDGIFELWSELRRSEGATASLIFVQTRDVFFFSA